MQPHTCNTCGHKERAGPNSHAAAVAAAGAQQSLGHRPAATAKACGDTAAAADAAGAVAAGAATAAASQAFGAVGQQVQKAAAQAAAQAAVNEVQSQFSNMMKTGFKR